MRGWDEMGWDDDEDEDNRGSRMKIALRKADGTQ